MDINDKAKILTQFLSKYKNNDNEDITEFIRVHDLGLPIAYSLHYGYVTLVDNGWAQMFIENAYDQLCEMLMCDPSLDYDNVEEMITVLNLDEA